MNGFNPKILLANNYFYIRGGSERYFFGLADLLNGMGHEVVPFSTKGSYNRASPYEKYFADSFYPEMLNKLSLTEKLKTAARVIYSTTAKRRALELINAVRPDLVHCHNIYGALSPSILHAFKRKGLPVVMTVHDLKLMCPNHRMYIKHSVCERCKRLRFYNCAVNKCISESWPASLLGCIELYTHTLFGLYRKNVDLFITPSDFFRKKLVEYGFQNDKIIKIPNFIDSRTYIPSYEHQNYIIYFGRLEQSKGVRTLVEAAAELAGAAKFAIAGDGPMKMELERYITARSLGNVRLLGQKNDRELVELIKNAMFTVVPSELYENSPYAIFESYACGKGVVGSNIGGIPELIDDGKTGLLFRAGDADDLADKISSLAANRNLAVQMGRCGREKVLAEYGTERQYEELSAVYNKLLGHG